jgi:hypothetical protein
MGLPLVQAVVEGHGGWVDVTSTRGREAASPSTSPSSVPRPWRPSREAGRGEAPSGSGGPSPWPWWWRTSPPRPDPAPGPRGGRLPGPSWPRGRRGRRASSGNTGPEAPPWSWPSGSFRRGEGMEPPPPGTGPPPYLGGSSWIAASGRPLTRRGAPARPRGGRIPSDVPLSPRPWTPPASSGRHEVRARRSPAKARPPGGGGGRGCRADGPGRRSPLPTLRRWIPAFRRGAGTALIRGRRLRVEARVPGGLEALRRSDPLPGDDPREVGSPARFPPPR